MSETLTAEFARERTVRIFSNGEDYRNWQWNNCDRCVKRPSCDLEEIIASASVLDGLISLPIATRLGVPDGGDPRWYCREREQQMPTSALAEETVASLPAVEHVRAAGAAQLPGFESVPAAEPTRTRGWEG